MQKMNEQERKIYLEMVSDPRFKMFSHNKGLIQSTELKDAVLAHGLLKQLNSAYGWNLPADMNLNGRQINDIIYEIVLKPGYSLDNFIKAIEAGRKL